MSGPSHRLHSLDSSASLSDVEPILALSNTIFDTASSPPSHHSSSDEWARRLRMPHSTIVFATKSVAEAQPVGFIFALPKDAGLHVWLAGVLPETRGTGVFGAMMVAVEEHARREGVEALSVATYPARFARMYALLLKTGWVVESEEAGGKVYLRKSLGESK